MTLKTIVQNLVLIVASLVFVLASAEIGLRLFGISYPYFLQPDSLKGWRLEPSVSGNFFGERDQYVAINSQGLRDREHSIAKPTATLRIAVLGDSYAEALQVPMEKTFWAILEDTLQTKNCINGFDRIEAINFGVSAYGTAQELLVLKNDVWQYNPEIVLLAFNTNNDFLDNAPALTSSMSRPFFRVINDRLTYDDSFLESEAHTSWVKRYRGLNYMLHDRLRVLQFLRRVTHNLRTSPSSVNEVGMFLPPRDDRWRDAWRVTEKLILSIKEEVARNGAWFVLVTITDPIQVDLNATRRKEFARAAGIDDLFYPNIRLQEFARQNGISVLTLAPKMFRYAKSRGVYLHGFENNLGGGHWNEHGHNFAGELIAEYVCENANGGRSHGDTPRVGVNK